MNFRLFVALDPPDVVRRRLAALQDELKRSCGRAAGEIRWAAPESIHLTLQFLGAVPEERVSAVTAGVSAAAVASRPVHLAVSGAGAFPSSRRARVVWAGVGGEVGPLGELVAALGRELAPLGFPPESRPFSPHLTLGRARDGRGAGGLAAALAHAGDAAAPWHVAEVVLYRSHLSPKGSRYEAIHKAPLGS